MLANWMLQTSMEWAHDNPVNRILDVEVIVDDNNDKDDKDKEGNDSASAQVLTAVS